MNTPQGGCMLEGKSGEEEADGIRANGRIVE